MNAIIAVEELAHRMVCSWSICGLSGGVGATPPSPRRSRDPERGGRFSRQQNRNSRNGECPEWRVGERGQNV